MINENSKIIAVDFDGTVVEDKYPAIGKPMLFAVETLKRLQSDGHKLVLWTYRYGKTLQDAVAFFEENGIQLYAVNSSYEGEVFNEQKASRKINADIFIDDRNVGGFPGWGEVYQMISGSAPQHNEVKKSRKKGLFRF
jgi:hydroxymethylpyrimidine pyrophosphatase-like HAD family hydrolase